MLLTLRRTAALAATIGAGSIIALCVPPRLVAAFATDSSDGRLVTIAEIVGQQYCQGDGEINTLQLRLRFTVTNRFQKAIVVYWKLPVIETVNVARDESMLKAGAYEIELTVSVYAASGTTRGVESRFLTTLKPNDSHTFDFVDEVAVPILAAGTGPAGPLRAGRHVLSIQLQTWPYTANAVTWADRISAQGTLWTDVLVTEALPFIVKSGPPLKQCDQ
jgi:hypothetical protein